jgi:hypothetical protein
MKMVARVNRLRGRLVKAGPGLHRPALCAVGSLVTLAVGGSALPEEAGRDDRRALQSEITAELRLGVSRGLQHLLSIQRASGDFDDVHPVAVNALVGLAFLSGGYTDRTGPAAYTEALKRGTAALLRRQNPSGYFEDGKSLMYGHGFATLYLAELYGASGSDDAAVRRALEQAIRVIEGSQSDTGGWDYAPAAQFGSSSGSFGASDTSITVCQTMALRAARDLGIKVDERVVARARTYIGEAQNDDGGFNYRKHRLGRYPFGSSSAFPRSAAGVCILYSLGNYNSEKIKKGFDYLYENYRWPWSNKFPYYAQYYCSQAMFQAGGRYWAEYFPWARKALLEAQGSDGSWRAPPQENHVQATAMALIVLQLPYRFLPIHER